MSQETAKKIDTDKLKEGVDLRDLAGRETKLSSLGHNESAGPCPKCGGDDRFHVKEDWFFCRQCNVKGGDAIAFLMWLHSVSFLEAVAMLEPGAEMPQATQNRRPAATKQKKPAAPEWDQASAERLLERQQAALWGCDIATEYLLGRGLESHSWLTFGLGYAPSVALPYTNGKQRAPAIVIPWHRGGRFAAVRYRFFETHQYTNVKGEPSKAKQTSRGGFRGLLFGGQAGPLPHPGRTLVLCEGELNAMSIWQVAHESRLDVLSIGSESAKLTDAMIEMAKQYGSVLVWADRSEVAKRQAVELGAHAVNSPGGKDANDLLQEGALGYALSFWRYQMADTAEQREALLWALWDAANTLLGVDAGTAKLIGKLASELGREVTLSEPEPGRRLVTDGESQLK